MKPLQAALAGSAVIVMAGLVSGCATTGANPEDPYEDFNRSMFAFNEGLDRAVVEPVAKGYRAITNEPIRQGVSNVLNNLGEPVTFGLHPEDASGFFERLGFRLHELADAARLRRYFPPATHIYPANYVVHAITAERSQ